MITITILFSIIINNKMIKKVKVVVAQIKVMMIKQIDYFLTRVFKNFPSI